MLQYDFGPVMREITKQDIQKEYQSDPWLCNYLVNWWEYIHGDAVLESYPWNVTIPIADVCNARCTFCTSWLEGTRVLQIDEIPRFGEVLRYARLIGIAGHGEPLAHPKCGDVFEALSKYLDPRSESYIITNGVFLDRQADALARLNMMTYNISVNAASAETHDKVMGLGLDAFEKIIASIRDLGKRSQECALQGKPSFRINLSFVINRDNVHETAKFIRLGNDLGATNIYLRTLNSIGSLPVGLNYHLLPPYLHPKFDQYAEEAKVAMAESRAGIITDVASWSAPVLSTGLAGLVNISTPEVVDRRDALSDINIRNHYANYYENLQGGGQGRPVEQFVDYAEDGTNPFDRNAPFFCYFLYHNFMVNDFNLRMIPCCYMSNVPGFEVIKFDGSVPFLDYWNSPAFVTLRRRLQEGPLFGACKKCPSQNVPH